MSTINSGGFIQEATVFLERLAIEKKILPAGKRLVVSVSFVAVSAVEVRIENGITKKEIDRLLARPIKFLNFSYRTQRIMKFNEILLVGDLVRWIESDLLKLRGFGQKSLTEVKDKLAEHELSLGMQNPIGFRERKALLDGPLDPYTSLDVINLLAAEGVTTVRVFLSKSKDEMDNVLRLLDFRKHATVGDVNRNIRSRLAKRGLL